MSATHTWTLSRIFPFIFGTKLQLNKYFIHYLNGIKIFFLLLADSYNEESIVEIEISIENYLSEFKKLYKIITPKLHFLAHYGRCIRTFGPLKRCWVMRFESKHSYFKKVQHSIHNTINTSKSLAQRHQYLQVSNHNFCMPILLTGPVLKNNSTEFENYPSNSSAHCIVKWAEYNSIRYYTGSAILNNENEFCLIEELIIQNEKLFMNIVTLSNNGYRQNTNCFEIKNENNNNKKVIEASCLKYVWPLDIYSINEKQYIILKYPANEISSTKYET